MRSINLFDIYQTKNGEKITYDFIENPNDNIKPPITNHFLHAYIDNEEAGKLEVNYIKNQDWFPNVFSYLHAFTGKSILPKEYDPLKGDKNPNDFIIDEQPEKILKSIAKRVRDLASDHIMGFRGISENDADKVINSEGKQVYKEMNKLEQKLSTNEPSIKEDLNKLYDTFYERPFIAMVRVYEGYERKGIGTRMYLKMAEILTQKGYALHESSVQSNEANMVWNKLDKYGLISHDKNGYRKLDLR